jgi:hypothetical protein
MIGISIPHLLRVAALCGLVALGGCVAGPGGGSYQHRPEPEPWQQSGAPGGAGQHGTGHSGGGHR